MKLLQDGVIAMLAAVGLATLLWLAVSLIIAAAGIRKVYKEENSYVKSI